MLLKKTFFSKASIIFASLVALYSSGPYFAWYSGKIYFLLLAIFMLIRVFLFKKVTSYLNKPALFFCFILWFYLYVWHSVEFKEIYSSFITILLPLFFVILFDEKEKKMFINYTTNLYAVILLFSLIYFIIWSFGVYLPYSIIRYPFSDFYPYFSNYYLFIITNNLGLFTRFQSIFTEPGHIGMIVALLLYINRYNFRKWQCWIFLISLIWSFSLAAYALFFIGITLYKVLSSKVFFKSIVKTFVFLSIFIFSSIMIYYSFPDSVVSKLIFERLEYDSDKGIVGNNRNEAYFMKYYSNFQSKGEYITGIGKKKYSKLSLSEGNSSYRVFIINYGLIGITLLALFFLSLTISSKSRLYFGLFILYCFSFYQRPYALWEIESFSYICFLSQIKNKLPISI